MATEFKLPEVGEGITTGTIVGVLVAVGDKVEKDQAVFELETDKAVVEVPSSVAGVVQEIRVKENEEASVGQVVLIVGEGDSGSEAEAADSASDGASGSVTDEATTQPEGDGSEDARPSAGAADAAAEEVVAEEVAAEAGDTQGSTPTGGGATAAKEAQIDRAAKADTAEGAQAASDPYDVPVDEKQSIPAAPSVRRLARELGVNLQEVAGSGIMGRISAEDVKRFAEGGAPQAAQAAPQAPAQVSVQAPAAPPLPDFSKFGSVTREPMSGIRKATVRAMANAWSSVPLVTQFDKADTGEFEALRKRYKARAEAAGTKLTPTAVLLKMVVGALKKYPKFNASLDVENNEVVYKDYVNIGVAVDTERGLLVPVVRDVDKKGILQLAKELGEIAEKARARKLGPEDLQGGNFSISNLGGIGGTGFTPIVNPPEVAILGVARGSVEPVWDAEAGAFQPRTMMPLSLSYDHRLIDGADAARFLRLICEIIEDPYLMSVEG
jgi:pyruvate dehydrogenase E2 component (dihydrolipoamide acetyltransferase)